MGFDKQLKFKETIEELAQSLDSVKNS